jgi:adenosylhomocysteine nucleosidase
VADSIADLQGNVLDTRTIPALDFLPGAPVHVGRLLTVGRIIGLPRDKRALAEKHRALAADMESRAVGEVCRRFGVPFLAVRVVSDAADDELPAEIASVARQTTAAGQFGAVLASVLNRPGSIKEMYQLKENALISSDRLARFLTRLIVRLTEPPALEREA